MLHYLILAQATCLLILSAGTVVCCKSMHFSSERVHAVAGCMAVLSEFIAINNIFKKERSHIVYLICE